MVFVGAALVVGTAVSAYGQYKSGEAQKYQIKIQKQQAELQNIRQVREQVRSRYRQSAAIQSAGTMSGVSGSSGVSGGISSLGAQMASNLSYMSDMGTLKEQEFGAAMDYAKSQQIAGYGDLISSGAQAYGSYKIHTAKK